MVEVGEAEEGGGRAAEFDVVAEGAGLGAGLVAGWQRV